MEATKPPTLTCAPRVNKTPAGLTRNTWPLALIWPAISLPWPLVTLFRATALALGCTKLTLAFEPTLKVFQVRMVFCDCWLMVRLAWPWLLVVGWPMLAWPAVTWPWVGRVLAARLLDCANAMWGSMRATAAMEAAFVAADALAAACAACSRAAFARAAMVWKALAMKPPISKSARKMRLTTLPG